MKKKDFKLEISTLNAFLHATSKPAQSNTRHCFDRLPQAMNQLIVQCLFPVRQANEKPVYRFIRAQMVQSRQANDPGILQILYQGHAAEAREDLEWKNRLDYTCRVMQHRAAQNLFIDFFIDPGAFTNNFHVFAPSPAFNKWPCMTYIQSERAAEGAEGEMNNERRIASVNRYIQHVQNQEAVIRRNNPDLNLEDLPIYLFQNAQNRPVNSRKVRFLSVCIAITSVLYTVCRAVVNVFLPILPALLLITYSLLIRINIKLIHQAIILLSSTLHVLLSTPNTVSQKLTLVAAIIFLTISCFCRMCLVGVMADRAGVIVQNISMQILRSTARRARRIPEQIKVELRKTWRIGKALFRERTRLAQMILLSRINLAGAIEAE